MRHGELDARKERQMTDGGGLWLQVDAHWQGTLVTVRIIGEADIAAVDLLREHLGEVVAKKPSHLGLDLGSLKFVDCAGARAIAGTLRGVPADCELAITSIHPAARKVFAITGLLPCEFLHADST